MPLKIFIADDHPIFLKGLKEVIEEDLSLKVMGQATNGQDAYNKIIKESYDLVILDIDMPGMSGLEVAEKLFEKFPDLPVIILTMHKEKAPFIRSLEIGVLGYVLKDNAVNDIVNAIYQVEKQQTYISPEMSAYLMKKKVRGDKNNKVDYSEVLTPSEIQILKMIATYKSSKEIADELFISEKTVYNHRMNMAKKLNLSGKNSLLRFALEQLG